VTPTTDTSELVRALLEGFKQADVVDELATHVRRCFEAADEHRRSTGVEKEMLRGLRAVKSVLDPEDCELADPTNGTDIYLPIINLKHRGLRSWISDILANSEDAPWTIKPTPLPELPPAAENAVVKLLADEVAKYGGTMDVPERAAFFKDVAQKHVDKVAATAAKRVEVKIKDLLTEGGWRHAFDSFLADLATHPGAILKGPVLTQTKALKWVGGTLSPVTVDKFFVRRVSPFDVYPSPNSTTPNDGDFLIERARMSRDQLLGSAGMSGFDKMAVRKVISTYPNGYNDASALDRERDSLEGTDNADQNESNKDQRYSILIYNGLVPVSMLLDKGLDIDGDPQGSVEAEVWVCDNYVLRAILNPHPLGDRRYYVTSFETIPGSFWGRSMPSLLRDVQRVANASARALVRNMAFSSGPIGEYDIGRLVNETKIEELAPHRMYAVDNDKYINSVNAPAIRFTKVDSVSRELSGIIDHFMKLADDMSGIPAYVLGAPQVAGAGRTLGGLSLLMGNAAKGIKHVISNVDRYVTEPLIQNYYTLLMLLDDDQTLKVDVTVVARGSSGLLQRELQQARAVEVLQMLTPFVDRAIVPVEGLQLVIRDVLRGLGYSADDLVPDPERAAKLTNIAGGNPVTPTGPGTPPPVLDGRSTPPPSPVDAARVPGLPE